MRPSRQQLLIREFILQMKEGHLAALPFQQKYGIDIFQEFGEALARQEAKGYLHRKPGEVELTRKGLLQVDTLLTEYFEPELREVRYT